MFVFRVGDKVAKNPATWTPSEFDEWGRGKGVGEVVKPPFGLGSGTVDVRWPAGRCFELIRGLMPAALAVQAADPPDSPGSSPAAADSVASRRRRIHSPPS